MTAPALSEGDRVALEALSSRLDHTAAAARLVARFCVLQPDEADVMRGVAETISELSERLDGIINPVARGVQ